MIDIRVGFTIQIRVQHVQVTRHVVFTSWDGISQSRIMNDFLGHVFHVTSNDWQNTS